MRTTKNLKAGDRLLVILDEGHELATATYCACGELGKLDPSRIDDPEIEAAPLIPGDVVIIEDVPHTVVMDLPEVCVGYVPDETIECEACS